MMGGMGRTSMFKTLLNASGGNVSLALGAYKRMLNTDLRRVPASSRSVTSERPVATESHHEREPNSPSVPLPQFNGQRRSLREGRSPN